jgi:hypothetical protein
MSNFDPLLKALQTFKAQGDAGFEGLVRDCLEKLSQRTLRLQKSGAQGGQDLRSDTNPDSPMIAIEAKRFQATTNLPLDEFKSKLRESLESSLPRAASAGIHTRGGLRTRSSLWYRLWRGVHMLPA